MIHFGNQVAHAILDIQYKFRATALEKAQIRILEEWGDSIKPLPEKKPTRVAE